MAYMDLAELRSRQAMPLDEKIEWSRQKIRHFAELAGGSKKIVVAFSGGKDSTVLLHLARTVFPDIRGVFVNTGLEYPDIVKFVRSTENVDIIKPAMSFSEVIATYGFPYPTKMQAEMISRMQRKLETGADITDHKYMQKTFMNMDGEEKSSTYSISEKHKWIVYSGIKVSQKCCAVMKKDPMARYQKENGVYPITGVMADEGKSRTEVYLKYGCILGQGSGNLLLKAIAFWRENDVWEYLKKFGVPYASIYDKGETRTGCVFCGFTNGREKENKFQRLQTLCPQYHRYGERIGVADVCKKLHIPYYKNNSLFDATE